MSGAGINSAYAHCKGKHSDFEPHCGGTEPPPDPDPGGSAFPDVVYRNDGIYVANEDGTNQTQIRSGGIGPKLDLINKRVLFIHKEGIANSPYLGMLPYSLDGGNISVGQEQELINTVEIDGIDNDGFEFDGKFSSEGVSDWSPDGSKFSYSYYWTRPDGQAFYRMMVAPAPDPVIYPDPAVIYPVSTHSVAYESEPNGGLNSATWDASGDFIYHQDNPLDGSPPNGLIVIDVRTFPGKTVAEYDLSPIFVAAGFSAESNVQRISASYEIGGDHLILDSSGVYSPGKYSFKPGDESVPATSDTSLCLMLSVIDWSRKDGRFVVIIDLPQIFDPNSSADGLRCSTATMGAPILDFQGTDFTTGDAGIVGINSGKGKPGGLWIYDLGTGSRTRIIGEGSFPDWSN
jgi:hypothetical protein